jgi:hypothetical protein
MPVSMHHAARPRRDPVKFNWLDRGRHASLTGTELHTAREALGLDEHDLRAVLRQVAPGEVLRKRTLRRLERANEHAVTTVKPLLVLVAVGLAVRARQAGSRQPIDVLILIGESNLSLWTLPLSPAVASIDDHHEQLLADARQMVQALLETFSYHDDTIAIVETLQTISAELQTV